VFGFIFFQNVINNRLPIIFTGNSHRSSCQIGDRAKLITDRVMKLMTTILTLDLLKKVDFDLQQASQQVKSHFKNGRE
jgi:hypothetical protein